MALYSMSQAGTAAHSGGSSQMEKPGEAYHRSLPGNSSQGTAAVNRGAVVIGVGVVGVGGGARCEVEGGHLRTDKAAALAASQDYKHVNVHVPI